MATGPIAATGGSCLLRQIRDGTAAPFVCYMKALSSQGGLMATIGSGYVAAGHNMRLIDLEGMRKLLRREVDRAGGQVAWAKRHGLHPSTINKVVNEQRMPGRRMLVALQLQKVTAYRRHG